MFNINCVVSRVWSGIKLGIKPLLFSWLKIFGPLLILFCGDFFIDTSFLVRSDLTSLSPVVVLWAIGVIGAVFYSSIAFLGFSQRAIMYYETGNFSVKHFFKTGLSLMIPLLKLCFAIIGLVLVLTFIPATIFVVFVWVFPKILNNVFILSLLAIPGICFFGYMTLRLSYVLRVVLDNPKKSLGYSFKTAWKLGKNNVINIFTLELLSGLITMGIPALISFIISFFMQFLFLDFAQDHFTFFLNLLWSSKVIFMGFYTLRYMLNAMISSGIYVSLKEAARE